MGTSATTTTTTTAQQAQLSNFSNTSIIMDKVKQVVDKVVHPKDHSTTSTTHGTTSTTHGSGLSGSHNARPQLQIEWTQRSIAIWTALATWAPPITVLVA